jgi:hypothetical protein
VALLDELMARGWNCGAQFSADLSGLFTCIEEVSTDITERSGDLSKACQKVFKTVTEAYGPSPGSSTTMCLSGVCCNSQGCY